MPDQAPPQSNWRQATAHERQLISLALDMVIAYERMYGGPPTLAWLLKEMGYKP